jgi:hypothetical protein
VTARDAMKELLAAANPGVPTTDGMLAALSMSDIKCYQCGGFGHYARNCPNPRPPPYVLPGVAGGADTGPHCGHWVAA